MAKAILEFDLDLIDDDLKLKKVLKADDMANFIFELSRNLERECEHACEVGPLDHGGSFEGVNYVFEKIHELLEAHDIKIENLVV